MGVEPTTQSLEDSGSATELHPQPGAEGLDRTGILPSSAACVDHHCYLSKSVRLSVRPSSLGKRRLSLRDCAHGALVAGTGIEPMSLAYETKLEPPPV